jgi:putative membrane protein
MLLVPLVFLPLVWLEWRNYGDLVDEHQLYVRQDWWRQKLSLAKQMNVQNVEITQGPIARMLGLSTLHFGIAGGTLSFSALPLDQAKSIRDRVMQIVAPVDFSALNRKD